MIFDGANKSEVEEEYCYEHDLDEDDIDSKIDLDKVLEKALSEITWKETKPYLKNVFVIVVR